MTMREVHENEINKADIIKYIISQIPNGAVVFDIGGEKHLFDNDTASCMDESPILNTLQAAYKVGVTPGEVGIKSVNAGDWFKSKFPKGFYVENFGGDYYLVSIDYNTKVKKHSTMTDQLVKHNFVAALSKFIPVYGYHGSKIIKCMDKQYKGNKIVAYIISYLDGSVERVDSDTLKNALASGQVECINLKLTSDNRIIDR